MKLYEIYSQWHHKKLTDEEAAAQLNLTVKDWRFRVTRYGKRLPLVLKTLDRIAEDKITRSQAVEILGVGERAVNQLEKTWGVSRPLKEYLVERAVTQVKWEIRKRFAIEYIAGSTTIDDAAEAADVDPRQMRRWVTGLLEKHFQMPFKDLRLLSSKKRGQLADEIEEAEGLQAATINVLNEVAKGEKAIEEVALERVLAKRANRKGADVRRIY